MQRHGESLDRAALAGNAKRPHLSVVFMVTEDEAAAIRAIYQESGELSAAVEVQRRFPGITDNMKARECARTIAGWTAPSNPPPTVLKLRPERRL